MATQLVVNRANKKAGGLKMTGLADIEMAHTINFYVLKAQIFFTMERNKTAEWNSLTQEDQTEFISAILTLQRTYRRFREEKVAATYEFEFNAVTKIKQTLVKHLRLLHEYRNLSKFILFFCAIFLICDLIQDTATTHDVELQIRSALFPHSDGQAAQQFLSGDELFEYMDTSVVPAIFTDPECGNGLCEGPNEFMGFGRFGCAADCGVYKKVTDVSINLTADFLSPEEALNTRWQICSPYHQACMFDGTGAEFPVDKTEMVLRTLPRYLAPTEVSTPIYDEHLVLPLLDGPWELTIESAQHTVGSDVAVSVPGGVTTSAAYCLPEILVRLNITVSLYRAKGNINTTTAMLGSLRDALAVVLERPASAFNWAKSEEERPLSDDGAKPTQIVVSADLYGYNASHWMSEVPRRVVVFPDILPGVFGDSFLVTSVTTKAQDLSTPLHNGRRNLQSQHQYNQQKYTPSDTTAPASADNGTTSDLIRLLKNRAGDQWGNFESCLRSCTSRVGLSRQKIRALIKQCEDTLIASEGQLHHFLADGLLDKLFPQLGLRSTSGEVQRLRSNADVDRWTESPGALNVETDDTAVLPARKLGVETLSYIDPPGGVIQSVDEERKWVRDDGFFPLSRYVKLTLSGSNYFSFGEFGALCDASAVYDPNRLRDEADDVAWCQMKVVTFTEQWGTCDGINPATNLTCYDDPTCHGSANCMWSAHSPFDRDPLTCLSTWNSNPEEVVLILDFGRRVQVNRWFIDTLHSCGYGPVTALSIEISNTLNMSALSIERAATENAAKEKLNMTAAKAPKFPGAATVPEMVSAAAWVAVLPPTQLPKPGVYKFSPSTHSAWEASKVHNTLNFGELYKSHLLENEYFKESGGYNKGWVAEAGTTFTNSFNFQRDHVNGQHTAALVSTVMECKSWVNVWNRQIGGDDKWMYRIYDLMLGGQCGDGTSCHSTVKKGVASLTNVLSGLDSLSQQTAKALCAHPCEFFHVGGGNKDMSVPGCDCKKGRSEAANCESSIEVGNSLFAPVWQLIFRQSNSTSGYKPKSDWWKSYEPIIVNSTAITGDVNWLEGIDSYRSSDSEAILFKMIWPQRSGNNSNTWSQISNPLKSTEGGVIGYTEKEINFNFKFWGGLEYNSGPQSLLDGSVDSRYAFYAIGASAPYDLESSSSSSSGGLLGPGEIEAEVELYISGPAPKEAYLYSENILDASSVTFSYQVEFGQLTLQASQNGTWVNVWSVVHDDGGLQDHILWSQCTDGGKNVGTLLCGKSGQATVDLKSVRPPFQLRFLPNLMSHLNPTPIWDDNFGGNPTKHEYQLRQMAPAMSVDDIAVRPLCVAAPIQHGTTEYESKAGGMMNVAYECDQGFKLIGAPRLTCKAAVDSSPSSNFWTTKKSKFVKLRMMAFQFGKFGGLAAFDNAGQQVNLKELTATDLLTGWPIVSFGAGDSTDGDPATCFDSGVWDYADLELLYEITESVDIERFEWDGNNHCGGGPAFNIQISLSDQAKSGPWYVSQPWVQVGYRKHTFRSDASLKWLRRDANAIQTGNWSGSPPKCTCETLTPATPTVARVEVDENSATIHFAKSLGVGTGCAEYSVHVYETSSRRLKGDPAKLTTYVGTTSPIRVTSLSVGVDYQFSLSAKVGGSQSAETSLTSPVKLACAAGKVKQGKKCVSCKLGKFSPTAGLSDCLSCPVGKFTKNKNARWMLVYRQGLSDFRSKADWLAPSGINLNNSEASTFSRLGALEGFRASDGNFTFKMRWPLKYMPNEIVWKQASNPMVAEGKVVSKYKSIDTMLAKGSDVEFGGLGYETSGFALASGEVGLGSFYGVGFTPAFKATGTAGLPGPGSSEELVELWCQIDYLSGTADMSTPSFGSSESNAAKLLDRQLNGAQADGGCARSMCLIGCQEDGQSDVGIAAPWWSVDLGSRMPISSVALTNRLDYERARDATTPYMAISTGDSLDQLTPCAVNVSLAAGETLSVACPTEGRYIKVAYADKRLFEQTPKDSGSKTRAGQLALEENRVMNLCEVSIQGGWAETGHTSCASCPVGQTTATDGTGETIGCVEQCEAGKFGVLGNYYEGTKCFACEPGQYSEEGTFGSCRLCPSGKFQESPGSSYCSSCDSGKYACSSGMKSCATPSPQKCPSSCNARSLELFCVTSKHGDGICNPECNTIECDYDGGDCDVLGFCDTGDSTGKCHARMLGDGHCDLACSTATCNFDNGDCCLRKKKISISFNVSNHHKANEPIGRLMPKQDTPRRRHIGMRHVVVGGVVLNQHRGAPGRCEYAGRFDDLGASCTGSDLVKEPYGADPVFLTTSTLYDEYIASRMSRYYNIDDPTQTDSISKQPYGFQHVGSGYPIVLDINLDQASARKRVTYLKEGFYIDELTKSLTLDLLIYNGPSGLFASIQYDCKFEESGLIKMDFNVGIFQVDLYKGAAGTFRLLLEMIFFMYIVYDIAGEFRDMYFAWKKGDVGLYFRSMWNYLDMANLVLFLVQCIKWISFVLGPAKVFDPQPRYNVYADLQAGANYFKLAGSGQGLEDMLDVIKEASDISTFFQTFRTNLMINIFLMILRTFKNLDFQPRLRLVTATLENAFIDLVHFLVLFSLVLLIFGMSSYIILGQKITLLSTPLSAFNACLALAFLGDTSLLESINELTDPALGSVAVCWFYSFVLLVNILLLNILLAILVDAYVKVKDLQGDANVPSMHNEVFNLIATLCRGRLLNPRLQRNSVALKNLTKLERASGFSETAEEISETTVQRQAMEFEFQGENYDLNEVQLQKAVKSFRKANSKWAKDCDNKDMSFISGSSVEKTVHAMFKQFHTEITEPVPQDEPTTRRSSILNVVTNENMKKIASFHAGPKPNAVLPVPESPQDPSNPVCTVLPAPEPCQEAPEAEAYKPQEKQVEGTISSIPPPPSHPPPGMLPIRSPQGRQQLPPLN